MEAIPVFVNGYGVPKNPVSDTNYGHYLRAVTKFIHSTHQPVNLYLAGGKTNRLDKSEARAMKEWFEHFGVPKNTQIILIEHTTTARDNLTAFRQLIGKNLRTVVIFCEQSRRPTMAFFADKLFRTSTIHAVPFDQASLSTLHVWKQRTIKLWIEELAWSHPWADKIRLKLRERHVARARKEAFK